MSISICGAPCCWGVEGLENPDMPVWQTVLGEAHQAGFRALELGPYGYLSLDAAVTSAALEENGLSVVAGTVFNDLVDPQNRPRLIQIAEDICSLITKLPPLPSHEGQHFPTPYLVIIEWGHDERDFSTGHSDRAPRLNDKQWNDMVESILALCGVAERYGVRPVIHPHAGGYIEFADEIDRIAASIPHEKAGLCLDTGHLRFSGMDPVTWLKKYADRLDYVHFKDINQPVFQQILGERLRFFEACGKGAMCPIGTGMLDYEAIRGALDEIGYSGYITIEQERDPKNWTGTLPDLKKSIAYLKRMGYEI